MWMSFSTSPSISFETDAGPARDDLGDVLGVDSSSFRKVTSDWFSRRRASSSVTSCWSRISP